MLYLIVALIAYVHINQLLHHKQLKHIAGERGDADICRYARSFDYRNTNTHIMREVWNQLQIELDYSPSNPFPIESQDRLKETYGLDEDDIDEVYWAVADRLGIDTENADSNPYFNQVTTVKDLVLFLHHQPKTAQASHQK